MFYYFPSDLFKNYKRLQLQEAILEYVATHNGQTQNGPDMFFSFAKHLDSTVASASYVREITDEGLYLIAIKLLEVRNDSLYITPEGIHCLQNLSLKSSVISTRIGYISNINWTICTLISVAAIVISLLSL